MNEALPYKFWGIEGGEIPVPHFPMSVLWNPPFKDKVVPKKKFILSGTARQMFAA